MKPTLTLIAALCLLPMICFAAGPEKQRGTIRLIMLPDSQSYVQNPDNIKCFYAQGEWIAANREGIDFVLHQGDITTNNGGAQWKLATPIFRMLDQSGVPYTFVGGNHDNGPSGKGDVRMTQPMNRHLPWAKYCDKPWFGGAFKEGEMDNTYHFFTAEGYKFLLLSLEFAPRNVVLEWANQVIESHPKHNVIINTHAYMYSDDLRMGQDSTHKWLPASYGLGKDKSGDEYANSGQEMWEKMVGLHRNVLMVESGHVLNRGAGRLVSKGEHGNMVYQMLANYQAPIEGYNNGGDAFLRVVDIDPKRKTIEVRTYSPLLDEFLTDENQQFTFTKVKLVK